MKRGKKECVNIVYALFKLNAINFIINCIHKSKRNWKKTKCISKFQINGLK